MGRGGSLWGAVARCGAPWLAVGRGGSLTDTDTATGARWLTDTGARAAVPVARLTVGPWVT